MDTQNNIISVGLVEDQQLVRQGIASLLAISDNIRVVWQAEDGQDALSQLANNPVDVLLSDIRMPNLDGIAMLKQIRQSANSLPVIMLTTFDDSELFLNSLQAGANGFLLKDVSLDKLLHAIETVAKGGYLIEPSVLKQMSEPKPAPNVGVTRNELLSEREREILSFMAGGFSNKEIANAVFLAEGTVKNHVSNILTKLDCRDRTQAVLKGLQLALI
ncbi:response regulator transcription factor [Shewanella baltica]|uniref:response regulator transcription factor n=1 Tax=Shewanella baltica TaxID=62322 RepID=UPI00217CE8F6|nr:response regulator transcription factor [Shewanella baltica]MCS6094801.1 response regulator transcription factor [Shewanella baltica]MCS6225541.1 response regulator transcription factor [Shewanella baltica]MCS6236912.1 response regulator transcription factor [Shewanella baltica]MCS6240420.1 response regulator transcription factor [Shewanella baltica]MCS6258818.1 response regulator transcription factor [Shewanella baltica]